MRLAVTKALKVLEEYNLTDREITYDDINHITETEEIICHWYPFNGRIRERYLISNDGIAVIAITSALKSSLPWYQPDFKHLTAHALGHHYLHRGSYLYMDDTLQCKHEEQAESFAAVFLMSPYLLKENTSADTTAEDLAYIFKVPFQLAERRIKIYQTLNI